MKTAKKRRGYSLSIDDDDNDFRDPKKRIVAHRIGNEIYGERHHCESDGGGPSDSDEWRDEGRWAL